MNKWIGGFLQLAAAVLFFAAGAEEEILFLPAAASQLAGLALWSRTRKDERALPPLESQALDARLARIEEVLSGIQADTGRLSDSRDFMAELYAEKPARSKQISRPEQ